MTSRDREPWVAACARANVENFRFHDVRHTWASLHVQSGTPPERLKEPGEWSSRDRVLRHAHLARRTIWPNTPNRSRFGPRAGPISMSQSIATRHNRPQRHD
ncbi:hypothetical protein [Burkholderia sp. S-53]|uniref:hypothetical protein n=1 Tax=Burkholderia sp. S-53 TaxID=2906514 RepID=UPI0021D3AA29|nr:hypothetical protein [Burkholderia sp. S-53]UXU92337.1 hypothetical protein LXM88_28980 [Burkholderia sp. S-53]